MRDAVLGVCWLVVCSWAVPVCAWNDTGHMLAALAAFDRLDEGTRATALELLRQHPRYAEDFVAFMPAGVRTGPAAEQGRWVLAIASTWPDRVRGLEYVKPRSARNDLVTRYNRPRWHYINQPLFLDEVGRKSFGPVESNVATMPEPGIAAEEFNILQALVRASTDVGDPEASSASRAVALCWLLHLTADLHQPLHTVALYSLETFPSGDRGGNLIRVNASDNLHALWDGAGGRDRRWGSVIRRFEQLPQVEPTADTRVDYARWAREGRALADEAVYSPEMRHNIRMARAPNVHIALPPGYVVHMQEVAARQIVSAGVRSALVLRTFLSPGAHAP